jgi:hypothetical protein
MEKAAGSVSAPALNAVYAKTIILGDAQTGRSALINNLDFHSLNELGDHGRGSPSNRKFNIVIDESNFFSTIELSSAEIEHPSMTAYLKVWEYTQHLSKKDEELAFRGALFCIITFDVCKQQSYRSILEKWIPLKEQLSPDSFLYVVGTNLDRRAYRQVELEEICKACAKKDAVYVEVSNANGTNFPLLRKLLCRRVHYMLEQKNIFSSPAFQAKLKESNLTLSDRDEDAFARSLKAKAFNSGSAINDISIPALEPNIMSSSVGSILSSCFDLEDWEGYEKQEQEMLMIADKIDAFVENLANTADSSVGDLHSLTMNDVFLYHDLNSLPPLERNLENGADVEGEEQQHAKHLTQSFHQLKEAFQILGLSMPEALLQSQPKEDLDTGYKGELDNQDPFALPSTARPNLRKMLVKLPGGHAAEMVLDLDANLEQQIELFLMSNGLHYDLEARRKLLQTTTRVQREYLDSRRTTSNSSNFHSSNFSSHNVGPSAGAYSSHPMTNRSAPSSRPSTANNTITSTAPLLHSSSNTNVSQALNTSR